MDTLFQKYKTHPIYKVLPFVPDLSAENFLVGYSNPNEALPESYYLISEKRPMVIQTKGIDLTKELNRDDLLNLFNQIGTRTDAQVYAKHYLAGEFDTNAFLRFLKNRVYKDIDYGDLIKEFLSYDKETRFNYYQIYFGLPREFEGIEALNKIRNWVIEAFDKNVLELKKENLDEEDYEGFSLTNTELFEILKSETPLIIKTENNTFVIAQKDSKLLKIAPEELQNTQEIKQQFEKIIDDLAISKDDVIGLHAIKESRLERAFANKNKLLLPSIALTKRGYNKSIEWIVNSFGSSEIVLIGDKHLISQEDFEIRDADFYSGMTPSVEFYRFGNYAELGSFIAGIYAEIYEAKTNDKKSEESFTELAKKLIDENRNYFDKQGIEPTITNGFILWPNSKTNC